MGDALAASAMDGEGAAFILAVDTTIDDICKHKTVKVLLLEMVLVVMIVWTE